MALLACANSLKFSFCPLLTVAAFHVVSVRIFILQQKYNFLFCKMKSQLEVQHSPQGDLASSSSLYWDEGSLLSARGMAPKVGLRLGKPVWVGSYSGHPDRGREVLLKWQKHQSLLSFSLVQTCLRPGLKKSLSSNRKRQPE